jgi:hypothetical protein
MRVRDHLVLGAAAATLVRQWAPAAATGMWAGSVLIDADHYLWFCLRHRRLSPIAAVRFFNQPHPPQHPRTRVLHSPGALLATFALSIVRPRMLTVATGMALHVALDAHHETRMKRAREAALHRDHATCRGCGATGPEVGTHLAHQPWLLPDYGTENLVSLCAPCHERAHTRAAGARPWS